MPQVWSLGCCLYEMCMLKHAFSADNLLGCRPQLHKAFYYYICIVEQGTPRDLSDHIFITCMV